MSAHVDNIIETGTTAHIRTRDLKQALDLLEGLQRIMASLDAEQRGRHAPDPLLNELRGIHGHGYNWEALRFQDGVGQGWSYIAASIEQLETRLQGVHANNGAAFNPSAPVVEQRGLDNDPDRVTESAPCRRQRKAREIAAEIVGQREGE